LTGKFDLTNVNNLAFYISGPKLLFETTVISTQQESNYIYLYTTKFGTSIKIRLNRKFESTEFETMRVNCILISDVFHKKMSQNLWATIMLFGPVNLIFYWPKFFSFGPAKGWPSFQALPPYYRIQGIKVCALNLKSTFLLEN
jgi:hypothetical protein